MFNTEISILLNTEKNPISKFNNTEIFNISTENTELSEDLNYDDYFLQTIFFFNLFSRFSVFFDIFSIFRYFPVGFGVQYRKSLILKKKIRKKKNQEKFF